MNRKQVRHCYYTFIAVEFLYAYIYVLIYGLILEQETNACIRTYAIAKCLMKRGFEDTCIQTVA